MLFLALVDYWDPVGEEGPDDCVGGETEVGIVRRDAWVVMVFGKGALKGAAGAVGFAAVDVVR